MTSRRVDAVRAIALIGPNGSGKTTLFESLLQAAGMPVQPGSVGDASPEAKAAGQTIELNLADFDFMGDRYAVIDCPGSVEFACEMDCGLPAADLALVVVDPDPARAVLLQPYLREVEQLGVPHAIFVNKIDQARVSVADLMAALQPLSSTPLVARQLPTFDGERVSGFIDLALERAFVYRPGQPSEQIDIPADLVAEEADARFHMLEQMADFDDELMEQLLSDVTPSRDAIFADLVKEIRDGQITPVFSGQAGKLTYARVFGGALADGSELALPNGERGRASGLFAVQGQSLKKIASAQAGDIVALGKVEAAHAGDLLCAGREGRAAKVEPIARHPLYELAIATRDRKDDVRLSGALAKLIEEDGGLRLIHDADAHEMRLAGQGDSHLRMVLEKLKRRYGLEIATQAPSTPYRETIRKGVTQRGRHKKQTGGHGQFGDVVIEIRPLARGEGFQFIDRITGGVVPRQWIPAVEQGVRDAMERGPLGFPVVDVAVTLIDGSYHAVDSSEMAFRQAGRLAMSEALELASPILLEPIEKLTIYAPSATTSKINSAVSSRRGQILGFDAREGWSGWDRIEVYLPHHERQDFILELRSLTQGLGTFETAFDHMVELTGRKAEEVTKAKAA